MKWGVCSATMRLKGVALAALHPAMGDRFAVTVMVGENCRDFHGIPCLQGGEPAMGS